MTVQTTTSFFIQELDTERSDWVLTVTDSWPTEKAARKVAEIRQRNTAPSQRRAMRVVEMTTVRTTKPVGTII